MDYLTDTSSVPSNYIFNEILSPLAMSVQNGIYDDYHDVADAILRFAQKHGVLPYDQTLGGRFVDYLSSCEDLEPDDPESLAAEEMIMRVYDLYDHFCQINDNSSHGAYYTEVSTRDDQTALRANVTSFATGICKDVVVATSDISNQSLVDLGGGSGGLLDTALHVGSTDFKEYVNIDLQLNDSDGPFLRNAEKFKHQFGGAIIPSVTSINSDFNDYVSTIADDVFFISIHSYYYIDYSNRDKLNKCPFSGVAHVCDLLFDGVDYCVAPEVNLMLHDNKMTGNVGLYKVNNEPMVFLDELPLSYPARFMVSLRESIMVSDYVSRSLVWWSPSMRVVSRDISGVNGFPVLLRPTNGWTHMRRVKIYELDEYDFFFLRKMGFYLSGKIDGVCGFLSIQNGLYTLGLRDGYQFIVTRLDGSVPNFGNFQGSINVEILMDVNTNSFQLWFINYSPDTYPEDPGMRRNFWRKQFRSFSLIVESAKHKHPGLYFKDYYWIPRETERSVVFPSGLPCDGIVLTDPYGYFNGFWKPFSSSDMRVVRRAGELVIDYNGISWDVGDPDCRFVGDGVYEVRLFEGRFVLVHLRLDKEKTGDLPLVVTNPLFDYIDSVVYVPGVAVNYHFGDQWDYYNSYGKNYKAVMTRVGASHYTRDQVFVLYQLISEHLRTHCRLYGGYYLVSDWVNSIRLKSADDPKRLWLAIIKYGFISSKFDPFVPIIRDCGDMKAVIKI